jgi:hypothetical protein
MGLRFVLIWSTLVTVSHGAHYWLTLAMISAARYANTELMLLLSYVIVPAAQWIALRLAGVAWRTEWLVATIGGAALAAAVLDVMRSAAIGGTLLSLPMTYMALLSAGVAVLQWVVLRRHVRRHLFWCGAALAVAGMTVALRWALTGSMLPNAFLTAGPRLTIAAAGGVVQGAVLAWLLSSPREHACPALRSGRAWTIVEWGTAAAVSVVFILAATRLASALLTSSSGQEFFLQAMLLPAIAGLVIGAMQWLLLRGRLPITRFWIVVSAAALAVPAALGIVIPVVQLFVGYYTVIAMRTPGAFALIGAWMGLVQWTVLRRHVGGAFIWIPATALAFSVWHLQMTSSRVSPLTVGVVAGVICGTAIVLLPARREPAPSFTEAT